jgi:hypothetical protein
MNNTIVSKILSKEVDLSNPVSILTYLNNQLQDRFQINQFSAFCYVVLDSDDQKITYGQLGYEAIQLVKIDSTSFSFLPSSCHPFVQVKDKNIEEIFGEQEADLGNNELLLCVPKRIDKLTHSVKGKISPREIFHMVSESSSQRADKVLSIFRAVLNQCGDSITRDDSISIALIKKT